MLHGVDGKTKRVGTNVPRKVISWVWELIEDDLRLTLAAQSLTLPVIFFTFHRLSLISPLTNVLIGWTMAPLTVLGLMTSFLGYVWLPLGYIPALVSWVLLEYVIRVVLFTAGIPFASIAW
jgi:competence protein ComEC